MAAHGWKSGLAARLARVMPAVEVELCLPLIEEIRELKARRGALVVAHYYQVPAITADGTRSKVVGLADLSGKRFIYSLFEAGEIWITDFSDPRNPQTERFVGGKQPYDALVTPDGRHYIAGLFGEDGLAMLDLWNLDQGSRTILAGYG